MKARALTDDEIARLRSHLQGANPRDRALFEVGVNCGLRVSEMVALNVGQVWQYDAPVSALELVRTKRNHHRRVPVNRIAKASLSALISYKRAMNERLDHDAPLFCNQDGHRLSVRGVSMILRGVYREMKLPGKVTVHSLRRTFATVMLNRGATLREIQELLGHQSLATTQQYLSVTDAQLERAVALLEG